MQKTNRDYPFIHNNEVIEWDIKSANTSLMRYYKLQPESIIDKLDTLPKSTREVSVGKLMRKDKEFAKRLESAFNDIVNEFIESNSLTWNNIVSIKKDAIFVKNFKIINCEYGPVHFIPKNIYKHVLLLPKYEFYINTKIIDVKGIPDDKLTLHKDGILSFIKDAFQLSNKYKSMHKFFKEFVASYKKKELEFDMYREFTPDSIFQIGGEYPMITETLIEEDIENLDISFNYKNIILPTIQATI